MLRLQHPTMFYTYMRVVTIRVYIEQIINTIHNTKLINGRNKYPTFAMKDVCMGVRKLCVLCNITKINSESLVQITPQHNCKHLTTSEYTS